MNKEDSRRELDAYNRMRNPKLYVQSGQMDKDRKSGKIGIKEIIQVSDAIKKK